MHPRIAVGPTVRAELFEVDPAWSLRGEVRMIRTMLAGRDAELAGTAAKWLAEHGAEGEAEGGAASSAPATADGTATVTGTGTAEDPEGGPAS